jgi:hypothetical protein
MPAARKAEAPETSLVILLRILEHGPVDAMRNDVRSGAKQIGCLFVSIKPKYQKNFRAIL